MQILPSSMGMNNFEWISISTCLKNFLITDQEDLTYFWSLLKMTSCAIQTSVCMGEKLKIYKGIRFLKYRCCLKECHITFLQWTIWMTLIDICGLRRKTVISEKVESFLTLAVRNSHPRCWIMMRSKSFVGSHTKL